MYNTQLPEGPYAGPVGLQLLAIAHRYHLQCQLESQEELEQSAVQAAMNEITTFRAVHGRDISTAINDKYAKYQLLRNMTE